MGGGAPRGGVITSASRKACRSRRALPRRRPLRGPRGSRGPTPGPCGRGVLALIPSPGASATTPRDGARRRSGALGAAMSLGAAPTKGLRASAAPVAVALQGIANGTGSGCCGGEGARGAAAIAMGGPSGVGLTRPTIIGPVTLVHLIVDQLTAGILGGRTTLRATAYARPSTCRNRTVKRREACLRARGAPSSCARRHRRSMAFAPPCPLWRRRSCLGGVNRALSAPIPHWPRPAGGDRACLSRMRGRCVVW